MTIQDWAAIGEIIGAIGVVVSLIYLAIQIRENSRQIRSGALVSINQLINQGFDPIYNSEHNSRVWLGGLSDPDSLNETDGPLFNLFMSRLMNSYRTSLVQYQHQTLSDADFQRYSGFFKGIFETPGGQKWFKDIGNEHFSDEDLHFLVGTKSIPTPMDR